MHVFKYNELGELFMYLKLKHMFNIALHVLFHYRQIFQ